MIGKTCTVSVQGYNTFLIQVEADVLPGSMGMQIVGLGDNAVKESKERIRSAIIHSGFEFPVKYIVINLAPNELPKEGSLVELAIAVSILIATEQLPQEAFNNIMLLGSLSLDGTLQVSRGMLSAAITFHDFSECKAMVAPKKSLKEIGCIPNIEIHPIEKLQDILLFLNHKIPIYKTNSFESKFGNINIDFKDIFGQQRAKQGLLYSAIGGHHVILTGAPGTGKTMLAKAFEGILPPPNLKESLEITHLLASVKETNGKLINQRPFRSPHHTTSDVALVGGGSRPVPGEVSLAHNGILFLDELLEFSANSLQALREPMEDYKITISRAKESMTFPADFTLLAATNPCRCGYLFSKKRRCSCRISHVQQLYRKIFGPFLDRISLEIETFEETSHMLLQNQNEKDSYWYRSKIIEAQKRMFHRNAKWNELNINDHKGKKNNKLKFEEIMKIIPKTEKVHNMLKVFTDKLNLSHRGLLQSLRTAISIMDFNETNIMKEEYLEEAFSYRVFVRYQEIISQIII